MQQKIDFLVFLKKPQKDFFSAKKMLIHVSCLCLLLLIIIVAQMTNNYVLERSVQDLQKQFDVLQQQIPRQPAQTASLEDRLMAYKNLNALGYGGLSDFLKNIADTTVCGLWLTQFQMMNGGRQVSLQGQFYQEELMSAYQQKLQQWTLLSGSVLTVQVTGPAEKEKAFQFSMLWDKRENIPVS